VLGDRDQVELELELRPLFEFLPRRHLARQLVVEDEGAAVGGKVDSVDCAVQSPAVDLQHRFLAVLVLAELRLEEPRFEAGSFASGLLSEEADQQLLDATGDRPLDRMAAKAALGRDLGGKLPAALGPDGQ
jgi:hypothetical protein